MIRALAMFDSSLDETNNIKCAYEYFRDVVLPPFDYSDLVRWRWVQGVSALDKFIHDLVRLGMIESFQNQRAKTAKFLCFAISIGDYDIMTQNTIDSSAVFEQLIVRKHSFDAFQDPDKICDALSLIWNETHKMRAISIEMGQDESYIRTKLKNIVTRRNQIVHANDYSSVSLPRQTIIDTEAEDVIKFIRDFGHAVYNALT